MASSNQYEKDLEEAASLSDWLYETRNKYYDYDSAENAWRLQQRDEWQKTFFATRNHLVDIIDSLMYSIINMTSIATIYHYLTELTMSMDKIKCLVSQDEFNKLLKLDASPLNCNTLIDLQHQILCIAFK